MQKKLLVTPLLEKWNKFISVTKALYIKIRRNIQGKVENGRGLLLVTSITVFNDEN